MRGSRVGTRWRVVFHLGVILALSLSGCGRGALRPALVSGTPPLTERPVVPSTRRDTLASRPAADPLPIDEVPPSPSLGEGPLVRVALAVRSGVTPIEASGSWRLLDEDGGTIVRAGPSDRWVLERQGAQLRARRADGLATGWHAGPITLRPDRIGTVRVEARAYRGVLRHIATDSGILVVNVVPLDDYLRGVVPIEIGDRPAGEREAVEAQAIAARSYTVRRLLAERQGTGRRRQFDLLPTVADQVYGGLAAERPSADAAVERTRGLVLMVGGVVADAPFFSTCGGRTAAANEVWSVGSSSHLRGVSDRIPGADRDYCAASPYYRWTRRLPSTELDRVVQRYLAGVTRVPRAGAGHVLDVRILGTGPSGRVARLELRTSSGSFTVAGNAARSVLRGPGAEVLPSAYFSLAVEQQGGRLAVAVMEGRGAGHGVGMCQWGAIGRARAGHDHRAILAAYYPGATVARIPPGLITP